MSMRTHMCQAAAAVLRVNDAAFAGTFKACFAQGQSVRLRKLLLRACHMITHLGGGFGLGGFWV